MKFTVLIEEIHDTDVIIEAESEEEALEKVKTMYYADSGNFDYDFARVNGFSIIPTYGGQ